MADHAILYDDDCGFCKRMLARVLDRDRDGRLRPVAIQALEGQQLLAETPEQERLDSWHLVEEDGTVHSAGAAAAPLARLLPRLSWMAGGFERFPRLTERAYRSVAANRHRLSRIMVLPLMLAVLLIGAGCGSSAGDEAALTIYVSAPSGSERAAQIVTGAEAALADAGGSAAGIKVRLVVLEGRGTEVGQVGQIGAGANARAAAEDSGSIAYIGEADRAETGFSVPITNQAGLLQIAPGPVAEELLAKNEGGTEVPPRFQGSGERTLGVVELDAAARDGISVASVEGSGVSGYLAMELILDAIERAPDPLDRGSVIEAYLAATDADSAAGTYTVDQLGRAIYRPIEVN